MRVMGLRVDTRVFRLPATLLVALWSMWLLAGCGSAQSTGPSIEAEAGPTTATEAKPAAARPTPQTTSTPLPTVVGEVGECTLEPKAQLLSFRMISDTGKVSSCRSKAREFEATSD